MMLIFTDKQNITLLSAFGYNLSSIDDQISLTQRKNSHPCTAM